MVWSPSALVVVVVIVEPPVFASTNALIVNVALAPFVKSPIVHIPFAVLYDPWLTVVVGNLKPAGNKLVNSIFLSVDGPLLTTVYVYVTSSPSFGVVLFTNKVVTNFASSTVILADKISPVVSKSTTSPEAALIVFVIVFPPSFTSTVALISRVAVAPFVKVPIVHKPVLLLYEPWVTVSLW